MSTIKESLILEDKFSSSLNSYIQMLDKAEVSSNKMSTSTQKSTRLAEQMSSTYKNSSVPEHNDELLPSPRQEPQNFHLC